MYVGVIHLCVLCSCSLLPEFPSTSGTRGQLTVSPPGPTLVNAKVGSNVTLAVSLSGAPFPAVSWFMGDLPVVTGTVGSSSAADVDDSHEDVLNIEDDGSLTFTNVQLSYANTYRLDVTKSGVGAASATFVLRVYGE